MAEIEAPAVVQPAFNELEFVDDAMTTIDVWGAGVLTTDVTTLRRVMQQVEMPVGSGGFVTAARFDVSGIVRTYFTNKRVQANQSATMPAWLFEDFNLKVQYAQSLDASLRWALNAVRQIGESLDITADGSSPLLTETYTKPESIVEAQIDIHRSQYAIHSRRQYNFANRQ